MLMRLGQKSKSHYEVKNSVTWQTGSSDGIKCITICDVDRCACQSRDDLITHPRSIPPYPA